MNIFTALKRVFSTGLIVSDIKNDSIKIIDTQRSQAYSKRNTFFLINYIEINIISQH